MENVTYIVSLCLGALILITVCFGYFKSSQIQFNAIIFAFFGIVLVGMPVFQSIDFSFDESGMKARFIREQAKNLVAVASSDVTDKIIRESQKEPDAPPIEASKRPIDEKLKEAVANAALVAPDILPVDGWVYLGRVVDDKTTWADGMSVTTNAMLPIKKNDVLKVTNDVYVREITKDTWPSLAPVKSVAKVGSELKVIDSKFNKAKIGGYYVWAKVKL